MCTLCAPGTKGFCAFITHDDHGQTLTTAQCRAQFYICHLIFKNFVKCCCHHHPHFTGEETEAEMGSQLGRGRAGLQTQAVWLQDPYS